MSVEPFPGNDPPSGDFATTHWSLVVAAGAATPAARQALAELCRLYWYPLYVYVRRRGHDHDRAQDLTQSFFAHLLEKNTLAAADQARGRFRAFLLTACRNFLTNRHDYERAQKRGGGRHAVAIDFRDADRRYAGEPLDTQTPERLFERRWALTLLEHVLERLRREYQEAGKGVLFERLKGYLTGDAGDDSQAGAAAELGMSGGAVKVAVHRLRQRYRDRLRDEIAQTVDDPAAVDDEIRDLFAALRGC